MIDYCTLKSFISNRHIDIIAVEFLGVSFSLHVLESAFRHN